MKPPQKVSKKAQAWFLIIFVSLFQLVKNLARLESGQKLGWCIQLDGRDWQRNIESTGSCLMIRNNSCKKLFLGSPNRINESKNCFLVSRFESVNRKYCFLILWFVSILREGCFSILWFETTSQNLWYLVHLLGIFANLCLTASYRRDSDITRRWGTVNQLLYSARFSGKKVVSFEDHVAKLMAAKTKSNHTAWFVSNCDHTNGANARWDYGQKLIKAWLVTKLYTKLYTTIKVHLLYHQS